jgi:hypothetical protein
MSMSIRPRGRACWGSPRRLLLGFFLETDILLPQPIDLLLRTVYPGWRINTSIVKTATNAAARGFSDLRFFFFCDASEHSMHGVLSCIVPAASHAYLVNLL